MYLRKESDQDSFNDYLYEVVKKYGYDSNVEYIKFYEQQIDVLANSFIPFEKVVTNPNAKNPIIQEVIHKKNVSLKLKTSYIIRIEWDFRNNQDFSCTILMLNKF